MPTWSHESCFPTSGIVCYLKRGYLSCVCILYDAYTRVSSLRGTNPAGVGGLLGSKADFRDPSEHQECSWVCKCMAITGCVPFLQFGTWSSHPPHPMHSPENFLEEAMTGDNAIVFFLEILFCIESSTFLSGPA